MVLIVSFALRTSVERMNDYAPQHSRIFKEVSKTHCCLTFTMKHASQMILVTSPHKPFTWTAKNTPRRHAIIKEYDPEIEALYAAAAETAQADDVSPPLSWDPTSVAHFIRLVVGRVMKVSMLDTEDLFQKGCDRYDSFSLSLSCGILTASSACRRRGYAIQSCMRYGKAQRLAQGVSLAPSSINTLRYQPWFTSYPHS